MKVPRIPSTVHGRVLAAAGAVSLAYGALASTQSWYPAPHLIRLQTTDTHHHYPTITLLSSAMMPWSVFVFAYVAVLVAVASPREEAALGEDRAWRVLQAAPTRKPWRVPLALASAAYLVLFVAMPDVVDRLRFFGALLALAASSGLSLGCITVADDMLRPEVREGVVAALTTGPRGSQEGERIYEVRLVGAGAFVVPAATFLRLQEGQQVALTIGRVSGDVMTLRVRA